MTATAKFDDPWFGVVPVRFVVGRTGRGTWQADEKAFGRPAMVSCGYKPLPLARGVNAARNDRRFSDVREG